MALYSQFFLDDSGKCYYNKINNYFGGVIMYRMNGKVRFSETDEQGRLKLGSLMNYMQDCVMLHCESIGVGLKYLNANHRVWLLSSW